MLPSLPSDGLDWIAQSLGLTASALRISLLAQGANATVYLVEGAPEPCVLKTFRTDCDTDRHFEPWCDRLRQAPPLPGLERFLGGRRIHGSAWALFSFLPGRPVSLADNPLTRPQLDGLFSRLFLPMDTAGLLNQDLNPRNLLTTPESVGIIDLEYLDTFEPRPRHDYPGWINSDDWLCPIPSNKVSFEREGLTPYLEAMSSQDSGPARTRDFLAGYLAASAPYHHRRASWLASLDRPDLAPAVRYEQARADALSNPSPATVLTQALRLQIYYDVFAHVFFVQWHGHEDISDYAGTHAAIRADAAFFLETANGLRNDPLLAESERTLLALDSDSVARMRDILAGPPLPDSPARLAFANAVQHHFPATPPDSSTLAAWLRSRALPSAFVPPGWSRTLSTAFR